CNKCWADNDPEACWFPTAALPCYRCDALKRACTYSGVKSRERGKVDPIVQRTFERSVRVRRAREFVEAQRTQARSGGAVAIGESSLALPTSQASGVLGGEGSATGTQDKSKEKGKGKAPSTSHKQRASASGSEWPPKQSRKTSRTQPPSRSTETTGREPLAPSPGPSRQVPRVPPVASLPLPSDQDEEEEEDPSNAPPMAPDGRRATPLVVSFPR
ncbi:hypothetical protein C0992_012993, partial [Termitomyces sp. T32_za158]